VHRIAAEGGGDAQPKSKTAIGSLYFLLWGGLGGFLAIEGRGRGIVSGEMGKRIRGGGKAQNPDQDHSPAKLLGVHP